MVCPWISVSFGQSKVDNVNLVQFAASESDQEIIRFQIAMNEVLGVDILDSCQHLIGQHEYRLQGKLAGAEIEQILQGWTQNVHDHHIEITFPSKPTHIGNTH